MSYKENYPWLRNVPNAAESLVKEAKRTVPQFKEHYEFFEKYMVVRGYSKSTKYNYSRAVAKICLCYNKSLLLISPDEMHDFLYKIAIEDNRSTTMLKHTVYGLKFFLRIHGIDGSPYKFPSFKRDNRLPIILSRQEIKRLISSAGKPKSRVMLALIYSAGLRIGELVKLKIRDIDFDRMQIRIEHGKGNKDRYVALSSHIVYSLNNYIKQYKPVEFLFNGKRPSNPIRVNTVRSCFHVAVKNAQIIKKVTVHSLRHSYATHLLEDGVDIVSIKEALGHSRIENTMIYLHVAQHQRIKAKSPLDTLYEKY